MSTKVKLVRVPRLTWGDFNPPLEIIAAARAREDREKAAERAFVRKFDAALRAACAARMALMAARGVANVARNACYAASRAKGKRDREQFTGGNYICPGPLPGVSCENKYGVRHYSPFYKGNDWKCPHCRKRQYKFSAIIARNDCVPKKLNVNVAPWYPQNASC